ncbi:MAG: histidine kinase [Bacteroidota bacterium]|nr:histidine kinase [Bacteroidota bacterium]
MKKSWYKNKWVIVLLHASVWILLFLLPFLLQQSIGHNRKGEGFNFNNPFTYLYIFNALIYISIFYFNAFILVPRFIYRKKIATFFLTQLMVVAGFSTLQVLFFKLILNMPLHFGGFVFFNLFPYLFIIACSTAYKMIQDRIEAESLNQEKENENLKTELSFLRSQVNPHFMFNVLNNMVALARKKSDLLEPSLIKLSSLLRYMLYETDEQKVPLEREVEYLKSYIDLQLQRFGNKLKMQVSLNVPDRHYEIEPMLLIPFVENAFKHGTGIIPEPEIHIDLQATEDLLVFSVANKYNVEVPESKDHTSGIGLTNVKRRLNLIYRNAYELSISEKDNWFTIILKLNLH